jgi:hypothetical protein
MTIIYNKQVLLKRGNTAASSSYTGPVGEVTLDTDLMQLRVHNGNIAGGFLVPGGTALANLETTVASITNGSATFGNIIPAANVTYSLGSEQYQWRDLWVSNNTIYIGNTPIRVDNGQLLVNNAPVGGGGLPTVTVPGESGTTYKGLQVSYGIVHSNSNPNELNVNKIVIHKPAVTTTTIHPTSSEDDFQVTGLGDSDVVAMFVFYGDTNGAKPVSTLRAFAEAVIDSVILDDGVEGDYNTVDAMKTAFYANYETLAAAADGLDTDFEFFPNPDTNFPVNDELTGQGSGTGFRVYGLNYNLSDDTISLNGYDIGSGYTQGDVIVIPGTSIQDPEGNVLATPDNDVTITITEVNQFGQPMVFAFSGTLPRPEISWPENSISDGGSDQYDTANYISTNLAQEISYNGGETVEDGTAEFGTGSTYTFVYDTAIFGLFATGSSATLIRTSGNSGADGNSTTEAGNIYGPDTAAQTFDNAVTHLNLIGDPYAGPAVTFTKTNYGDEVDEISEGLHITRGEQGWLYNPLEEEGHDDDTPTGSLWNNDGWDDFGNVESRTYTSLESIWGGNFVNIVGAKMVMLDTTTGKYWAIEFLSWTNNQQGGGVSYTRQELDLSSLEQGIRFSDGTRQTTAYVATNVKLRAQGNRRIEEVYGYKQVSVSEDGEPVVWWDKDDLPGGSANFRGAVIDYHAYIPGEGTIIGTIHIVDDDGDEHITHTEVSSGSGDLENSDLWLVTSEGEIKYRRIDGESSTMKVQWSAKVFYGSEYYDD